MKEGKVMKQLGNLAIVCARRKNVLFQLLNGVVTVYVGESPNRISLSANWDDDAYISNIIHELNFGKFRSERSS